MLHHRSNLEYGTGSSAKDVHPKEPILNIVDNNIPRTNDYIYKPLLQLTYDDELKNLGFINSSQGFYNSSTDITKDSLHSIH